VTDANDLVAAITGRTLTERVQRAESKGFVHSERFKIDQLAVTESRNCFADPTRRVTTRRTVSVGFVTDDDSAVATKQGVNFAPRSASVVFVDGDDGSTTAVSLSGKQLNKDGSKRRSYGYASATPHDELRDELILRASAYAVTRAGIE
jgi:hypothetical protein